MGIASLVKPPVHSPSSGSSSAGGALGVTPAAPAAALCIGLGGTGLDGDKFTAMFPM